MCRAGGPDPLGTSGLSAPFRSEPATLSSIDRHPAWAPDFSTSRVAPVTSLLVVGEVLAEFMRPIRDSPLNETAVMMGSVPERSTRDTRERRRTPRHPDPALRGRRR